MNAVCFLARFGSLLFFTVACTAANTVYAGAWTLPEGTGQAINTLTFYRVDRRFDEDGERRSSTRFEKIEFSPYIEYGLRDDLTIGTQPSFQYLRQESGDDFVTNSGFADVDLFVRQRLWQDEGRVFSVQAYVSLPTGYNGDAQPALGDDQIDLELRLLFGQGLTLSGRNAFYNIEGAYRWRLEAPADEVRLDLTAGIRPNADWLLLAQSFNTIGVGNEGSRGIVQTSGPDYDIYKLQLSGVRQLSGDLFVQLGGYTEYAGRNTGAGNAVFTALWITF